MILFVVSALLALGLAWRMARLVSGGAEQFWVGLAALTLPWGLIANALSVAGWLTPWGWLGAQVVLGAAVWELARRWEMPMHPLARPRGWAPLELAVGAGIAAVLGLLAAMQWAEPIYIGDEIRYHASRVLYWMGNQSIFPYATHNDRQTYFGYQGELAFLWPVLFTRMEAAGRMIFWLATPLSCGALYAVARKLGGTRMVALLATLWFLVTPIVLKHGYGLKPEVWLTLYFLGAVWWLLDAVETGRGMSFLLAGVFAALAMSTKLNVLAILPVLLAAPWVARGVGNPARAGRALATGLVGASLVSGIALLLVFNTVRGGNPLGPAGMREVHSAAISGRQIRTHLARLPLLLTDPPMAPEGLRTAMEGAGRGWLAALDAAEPLPLELPAGWPGQFQFTVAPAARTYSLGGWVLLAVLLAGAWRVFTELRSSRKISGSSVAWALLASLLFGVVLAVRWMVHSGLPERFLLPCFAVAMAMAPGLIPTGARVAVLALGVVWTAYNPLIQLERDTVKMWVAPPGDDELSAPFTESLEQMGPGSRILFFGNQDAPDYGLFGAANGYDHAVTPWGKGAFDAAALERLVEEKQITHVLFQDGRTAYFHWDPALAMAPFVEWASRRAGSRVAALETPNVVLVEMARGAAMPKTARPPRQLLSAAPADKPLISVDADMRAGVGIDGGRMGTPWPIENLGPEEQGYLWLGSGAEEGLRFRVWSDTARTVSVLLRAGAGPSRTDGERTLALRVGAVEQKQTFTASGEVRFEAALAAGVNAMAVFATDAATVAALPNGDTRHLIVGLRDVAIGSLAKASRGLVRGKGVGIDSGSVHGAWPVEDLGAPENEFLWLGSGESEGVAFGMTAPGSGVMVMRMVVSPGPSRTDAARHFVLQMDGKTAGEKQMNGAGTVEFRVAATAGRHVVKFYAKDGVTVMKLTNGDPRHLIAGLHEITVEAGAAK